jgi:hypothetical protein
MKVSIMQPAYLPWAGYFDRIFQSDLHIVLDHVLIDANSKTKFANRNKVKTSQGWCWLTVPLKSKGRHGEMFLNQIEVSNESDWAAKHWNTFLHNYRRAPYFRDHESFFAEIYAREWNLLNDLIQATTEYMLGAFGIKRKILYSSAMDVPGEKDELIFNLCRATGATTYISGPFGRDYLNDAAFSEAGIRLAYHEYAPLPYPQLQTVFEPCMSAVDILFNCGPESLDVITRKQKPIL